MIIHRSGIKIHCSSEQEARGIGYRYLPEEAQGTWRQGFHFAAYGETQKDYGFQKSKEKKGGSKRGSFKS